MKLRNPSSFGSRFTKRFLVALGRISRSRAPVQRFKKVKMAAEKSLAKSAGTSRVWSRAVLNRIAKLQGRQRGGSVVKRRVVISRRQTGGRTARKRVARVGRNRRETSGISTQTDELRKLIPGGDEMNLCRLLDEVAHYMQCLKTQVQVMRRIANLYDGV